MNAFLVMFLQCGIFVLIPAISFGAGLWLIVRYIGKDNQISFVLLAVAIGFSFFEASTIGMLMDSRAGPSKLFEVIKTSGLVGLSVTVSILILVPVYRAIIKMFK